MNGVKGLKDVFRSCVSILCCTMSFHKFFFIMVSLVTWMIMKRRLYHITLSDNIIK